jgi:16S rRNA (cytidine1402-2'-O)-methyltransferase
VSTLYVVPTPIGNLEDITLRALRVLRDVPLVLAEDTRHTRKLLAHYSIRATLWSYHQHNKILRLDTILDALSRDDAALVSDSGTPSVADPGFELIEAARAAGIEVDVLPGPSAVVTALVAANLPAPGFLFAGFLPRRAAERRDRLAALAPLPYSLVVYESPHRLLAALGDIQHVLGDRAVVVARELSKLHQDVRRGTAEGLIEHFRDDAPRGEVTIVIAGSASESRADREAALEDLRRRSRTGEDRRSAIRAVEARYGVTRNEAYRMWLQVEADVG